MGLEEQTAKEISEALVFLAKSDACENSPLLSFVMKIAASHLKDLAQAKQEADSLALSIWEEYYKDESPNFELLDSVAGVITQIDNMVSGLYQSTRIA